MAFCHLYTIHQIPRPTRNSISRPGLFSAAATDGHDKNTNKEGFQIPQTKKIHCPSDKVLSHAISLKTKKGNWLGDLWF